MPINRNGEFVRRETVLRSRVSPLTSGRYRFLRPLFVGRRILAVMSGCVVLGIGSFYTAFHALTAWTCLFAVLGILLWITTALVFAIQASISNNRARAPLEGFYERRSVLPAGIVGFEDWSLDALDDEWLTGSRGILLILVGILLGALSFGLAFGAISTWTWLFAPLSLLFWGSAGYVFVNGFWHRYI